MANAILYMIIADKHQTSLDFDMPDDDEDLTWEENIKKREFIINMLKKTLYNNYITILEKYNYQHYYMITCKAGILNKFSNRHNKKYQEPL